MPLTANCHAHPRVTSDLVDAVHPLAATEQHLTRSGAFAEKWGFLVKLIPCLPQHVVPDLYTQAEKRVDRVDEVISRLPLVDNGAAAEDGAITLQARSGLFFCPSLPRKPCGSSPWEPHN